MSRNAILLLDALAWACIHVAAGYLVHRLPAHRFERDTWLTRPRRWERGGRFYVDVLRIKRWKHLLPEAGAIFSGGFDKRHLAGRDPRSLATYARETRRAELGHWLSAAGAALFFLWNPWPGGVVMVAYAVVVNGPCICSQRYNRVRLLRIGALRPR